MMNKYISNYKRKRTEEVSELVSYYKQQRSFSNRNQPSTSSSLPSLNNLSLTPWDYNIDANIVIKTEKDLALDPRDFDFNIEPESQGSIISSKEYYSWLSMENNKTGEQNSVSFASMMTDPSSYEEQYLSLKIFLAACNSSYKRELTYLLFPVFVHFYLDLIAKPDLTTAQSFYNKFYHDHEEHHKEQISSLQKVTTTGQLLLHPNVNEVRIRKINIKLSTPVYLYLLQHLRHGNYTLVLQTLNRHFNVRNSNNIISSKHYDDFDSTNNDNDTFEFSGSSCTPEEHEAIMNLKKSSTILQNSAKIMKPSICIYSVLNACHGLTCTSFSNKSSMLAAGFEDSSVRYWNIVANDKSSQTEVDDNLSDPLTAKECHVLRGHSGTVYQVEYFEDDQFMISASQDKSVRLWDVNTSKCLVEYRGHNYSIWDTSCSPQGCYFVSASLDRTIRLWNIECSYPLRILAGHNESVDCVAFHPNGNYFASGSSDKSCRLWDIQSGQFVRVFVGHKAPIRSLAFSKDGKYLVTGGEDKNIIVWDLSTGQLLNEISGHTKTLHSLSFSDDGAMIASGGADRTIRVWESESILKKTDNSLLKRKHDFIGCYLTNLNNVTSLKFSQGNLLLSAGLSDR